MSWDAKFFAPIPVPGRRKPLVTLRDAVKYMTSLPHEEHCLQSLASAAGACFSQNAP
jgi:hypothetical protein